MQYLDNLLSPRLSIVKAWQPVFLPSPRQRVPAVLGGPVSPVLPPVVVLGLLGWLVGEVLLILGLSWAGIRPGIY